MALARRTRRQTLTEDQRQMYASEKLMNFRWISKVIATYSPYTLSSKDFAPAEIKTYLSEIGQFAEIAYSANAIPTEFIFDNMTSLLEPDFPLEEYPCLRGAVLISAFKGTVADLPGYIAYQPHTKQLVVAFSGTWSGMQALYDVHALKHRHPSRHGRVHSGFWQLYKGVKAFAFGGIRKGLAEHEVEEIVITGHSMGGTVSQFLLLDILRDENLVSAGSIPLKLVVFGAPRCGTNNLANYWQELLAKRRKQYGDASISEYSVKTYNDGVPSLPPLSFGYHHFAQSPLYFVHGNLYQVPPEFCEHALFHVTPDTGNEDVRPEHPRGGHNYYNGRDMEKLARRLNWLNKAIKGKGHWKELYRARVARHTKKPSVLLASGAD
ncbi:Alpha/Beta hydrolase protein [Mycena belliarum]|uniref:Alpha/Beta hydrolase protein n=1 Tax=Mycena belliarum TaxID=1033014 RepID=A0AAD6UDX6_9AGAR|nr:Alpha/Beta hydrolase protein [Mycena belliae]